jgi:hypothetical protein
LEVIDRLDLSWFLLGVVSIACGYQAMSAIPQLTEQLRTLHNDQSSKRVLPVIVNAIGACGHTGDSLSETSSRGRDAKAGNSMSSTLFPS